MIDFRYHIVSLISVFLALAVGIVLGAGPLKETIGQSLTGQVNQLRQEKDTLRDERDSARRERGVEQSFVDYAAAELLADRLTGQRVAIVCLTAVPAATVQALDARLGQAGAVVTGQVVLTDAWTDPDPSAAQYRRQLSDLLAPHLNPAPPGATTDVTLATGLAQALTGADSADPTKFGESAKDLLGILTTSDNALVTKNGDLTGPADAIVVVAPLSKSAPKDSVQAARLAVVAAAQHESDGAVLVGDARGKGSLVDALLADPTLAATVTSVSGISATSAQVTVPMALAAQIGGKVGHYGHGDGETVLPPTVTLPGAGG